MSQPTRIPKTIQKSFLGKYVLDSLSFGMYNHPYMVLREYVQNGADAIDEYIYHNPRKANFTGKIDISIDGRTKSIKIIDNGIGIHTHDAWHVLHDLGRSEKDGIKLRGFRGIGRLGGLGYCDTLTFITKSQGEDIVTTDTWDCETIRNLVNDVSYTGDVASIIECTVQFKQEKYGGNNQDHFFIVEMKNLKGNRGLLSNVPGIKNYLSQVAPVPFNSNIFSFSKEIEGYLRENVPSYNTYSITVNNEVIFKPYSDNIGIKDNGVESIKDIIYLPFSHDDSILAFGWICDLELRGTVWASTLVDGIRLRKGNILIGNKDTLADFYRERRFNNYMVGEIHIIDSRLIPNSRRDDLEDNELRDYFHNSFIRDVGIPYSRKIRDLSVERSKERRREDVNSICSRAQMILEHGFITESQKTDLIAKLQNINGDKPKGWEERDIDMLIQGLFNSGHVLDSNGIPQSSENTNVIKQIFEVLYRKAEDKSTLEFLIGDILSGLDSSTR